jgi:hypothetical protein
MEVLPDDGSHGIRACCKLAASATVDISDSPAAAIIELASMAIKLVAGAAIELVQMAGTDMELELTATALKLESSPLTTHKCSIQFPRDSNGARHPVLRPSSSAIPRHPWSSSWLGLAVIVESNSAQTDSDGKKVPYR